MPRYAIAVADDPHFASDVRAILSADPRFVVTPEGIHADQPLTNLYEVGVVEAEWEGWEPDAHGGVDPRTGSHLVVECRDPHWLSEVCAIIWGRLDYPAWLIDNDDNVSPLGRVDPDSLILG